MNKKGSWWIWVGGILIFLLLIVIFLYFTLFSPNHENYYSSLEAAGTLVNPVSALNNEQAVNQFDDSFVYYLLVSIKAYNLHNPPLSSDTPKMNIYVDNLTYSAEIVNGEIKIYTGEINNPDINIRTTKDEAVKMLRTTSYISVSFQEGKSSVEKIAGQSTLFGKGYLNLYNQITGSGLTGNVIRIYTS